MSNYVCSFSGASLLQWKLVQWGKYPPGSWVGRTGGRLVILKGGQIHQCGNGPSLHLPPHFMNKTEIHWSGAFPGCRHISDYSQLFILGRWSTKMKVLLGNRQDNGSLECFVSCVRSVPVMTMTVMMAPVIPRIPTSGRVRQPITRPSWLFQRNSWSMPGRCQS